MEGSAIAWIESHQTLREHPKTYELMDALKIEKAAALGHLQMFWWWCIDYALDGRMKPNSALLSRAADWKGDIDTFANAMLSAGWIDLENDEWVVHDWHDYCGELVEKRLSRKVLKRKKLSNKRLTKTAEVPTNPDKNQPTLPYPTVPNRTQPNHTVPKDSPLPPKGGLVIPDDLKEFSSEIRDWMEYKRQKGQGYKPKGLEAFWNTFRAIPPAKRREAVNRSMAANWAGLFEHRGDDGFVKPVATAVVPGKYDHLS